jgi:hypothetical protein
MSARNPQERRLDRRIPMGCNAWIKPAGKSPLEAECIELGVGGMTLRSGYVPGEGETLEVQVSPLPGAKGAAPLRATVQVKRCHEAEPGRFEIGVAILQVLP